jgi:hypothetical protein
LQNVFCSVFELPSLKNTRKCDKTKKSRGKTDIEVFVEILGIFFDTDFLPKYFYGVFELPLLRNAQKRTKKKSQEKKSRMVGGWVRDLANVRGGPSIFFFGFWWPLGRTPNIIQRRFGRWRDDGWEVFLLFIYATLCCY